MRTSKATATFLTKFSAFIAKFKQSSTVNVAHQQIRKLFSQHKFSDIAIAFVSKMDSCDLLSEKEKKQFVKIYITFFDVYGQDAIMEYYDRIIDSIAKKNVGVSQVIGHICRTLLQRIEPEESKVKYIKHLINIFQKHIQFPKIIKQIIQNFEPQIISQFELEIMQLISEKLNTNIRNQTRVQYIEAILSLILSLEEKFREKRILQVIVVRNIKSEDWNARKLCVDISYAILVIDEEINENFHQPVLQLKYDKIKHVRDSVNNYINLYRQIYGVTKQKSIYDNFADSYRYNGGNDAVQNHSIKHNNENSLSKKKRQLQLRKQQRSIQKSIKNSMRNQNFFKNAGNKDVIKIPQLNSSIQKYKLKQYKNTQNYKLNNSQDNSPKIKNNQKLSKNLNVKYKQNQNSQINFENYIKPKIQKFISINQSNEKDANKSFGDYNNLSDQFKQSEFLQNSLHQKQITFDRNNQYGKSHQKSQINLNSNTTQIYEKDNSAELFKLLRKQMQLINKKFDMFSSTVLEKLNKLQKRIEELQDKKQNSGNQNQPQIENKEIRKTKQQIKQLTKSNANENSNQPSLKKQDFEFSVEYNKDMIESQKYTTFSIQAESNLSVKIHQSLKQNNWDEAYSLAIANNKSNDLMQLIKYCQMPKDKLVQDCLFAQLRKNLNKLVVLKWLITFCQQCSPSPDKMKKLYNDLMKDNDSQDLHEKSEDEYKQYKMLKYILENEVKSKLQGLQIVKEKQNYGLNNFRNKLF